MLLDETVPHDAVRLFGVDQLHPNFTGAFWIRSRGRPAYASFSNDRVGKALDGHVHGHSGGRLHRGFGLKTEARPRDVLGNAEAVIDSIPLGVQAGQFKNKPSRDAESGMSSSFV